MNNKNNKNNEFAFETSTSYQQESSQEQVKEALSLLLSKKVLEKNEWLTTTPPREIARLSLAEMVERGLTKAQAQKLKAAIYFGREAVLAPLERGQAFVCSSQVARHFQPRIGHLEQETFWALLLDQKNKIIKEVHIATGTLNRCPVHPREVFSEALREKANAVILVHNHPSGDCEPSPEDRALTERLQQVGNVVGINVLDHVVVTTNKHVSFADRGWL